MRLVSHTTSLRPQRGQVSFTAGLAMVLIEWNVAEAFRAGDEHATLAKSLSDVVLDGAFTATQAAGSPVEPGA